MSNTTFRVRPNPDGEGWLVIEQTDQEAFAWDKEHHGEAMALENWREIHEWRAAGRPKGLLVEEERSG